MNRKGFTLVELLIVIVIFGIVISLCVSAIRSVTNGGSGRDLAAVETEVGYVVPSSAGDFVLPPDFEGEAKFYVNINGADYEIQYRGQEDVSIQLVGGGK